MRHKLLLINPKNKFKHGIYHSADYGVPAISLGIIAALTPEHWDIEIIDENFEEKSLEMTYAQLKELNRWLNIYLNTGKTIEYKGYTVYFRRIFFEKSMFSNKGYLQIFKLIFKKL